MPAFLKNKLVWGLAFVAALTVYALLQGALGVEWAGYGFGEALSAQRAANPQVAVVAIDAAALKQYGPLPWPRSQFAKLVDVLTDDKVAVVALTEDLSSPQNAAALGYITELQSLASPDAMVNAKLGEAQAALDTDAALAASIVRSGRVLVAARGTRLSAASTAASGGSPTFALPLEAPAAPAVSLDAPLPKFVNAARGVGFLDEVPADTPQAPLLVQSDGHAFATLALLTAARQQDIETSRLGVQTLGGITLGDLAIRTDRHSQVLLRDGAEGIPRYGFADVLSGAVPAEKLAGKAVLVGRVDAEGRAPVLRTAALVSGLLNGDLVSTPFWAWGLRALLTLAAGLYLLLLLPHLSRTIGLVVTAFLAVALLNGEFVPLLAKSLWLPLMLPTLSLLLGHLALGAVHFVRDRSGVSRGAMSELNREYAMALQALNRFDQAFQRFRLCLPSRLLCDNLMALGQEHERGRRYSQALEVYAHVQRIAPAYEGLGERLERLRQLESTPALARTGSAATLSRAISSGGVQKPMLGRYELVQELGRGAMGVVFLGKDAKIGRQVAIKTMALADEFDGEALKDVHERFFREAETAGRLNHSNIVTIYDVGEDQGLAYIAMDYLQGDSLQKFTDSKALLPMGEALAVAIKVAEGLDYAHKHHVVHRDIKPANIMYDRASGRVKITDFGIAALTDMSKTKTGTILGSPLYMSPEQVQGHKLDGRSDLYSLGVTIYQLLRGELPFEAPSLTGLMFKIANEPHPDVTFLRPDIPATVKVVVDKALQKDPDARFQTGMEFANALRLALGVRKRTPA
ncbi:MAG TPA: serine/threonine-protein kinase [Gammaproteobacteria bacterium]|jgi:serine/threonine-protein kinase|nr:serine/threonine-protein kinase [Gammaproteobacteria bacterium]